MKNRKPYPYFGKQFYVIKYKGKIMKKFGVFRSKYLAEQTMKNQSLNFDKKNWKVDRK